MAVSFIGGGNWSTRRKPPTLLQVADNGNSFDFINDMLLTYDNQ
jgi:hypothetical protein